jgi:S1-C subfamily serine protease
LGVGGRKKVTTYALQTDLATPVGTISNAVLEVDTEHSKLGNSYLSQFGLLTLAYTTDQPAVYFPDRPATATPNLTFGFAPIFDEAQNAFIVGHLYRSSAAEQAGLKVDDVILSLNGQDLSRINFVAYCRNNSAGVPSYSLGGDAVSITVLRNKQKLAFSFKKRPLFPG